MAPAIALLATVLALLALGSWVADRGEPRGANFAAPFDHVYAFDASGPIALTADADLPVPPGTVVARWYALRGWDVVMFEGLDLGTSGPMCVGVSVLNAATHQLEHLSSSPTTSGACHGVGAGQLVRAASDRGVRECGDVVGFITSIPAETAGVLNASLTAFSGDGTGVGIAGRLETSGMPGELDVSVVDCGPLPIARQAPASAAVPSPMPDLTPLPASTGSVAWANRAPPPSPMRPTECPSLKGSDLDDVTIGAAAPYLIHRPSRLDTDQPTIVFLAGGSGGRSAALRVWETIFAGRPESETLQVVLPYSTDVNFIDESPRTLGIVNDVLACFGGDPFEVHLAGTSNGGLAAFALMAAHPETFATLLGAPGAFPVQDPADLDPAALAGTLAGRAVFNGVGVNDDAWKPEVVATHNALARAGVESSFAELPGQGHVLSAGLDPTALFEFWRSH